MKRLLLILFLGLFAGAGLAATQAPKVYRPTIRKAPVKKTTPAPRAPMRVLPGNQLPAGAVVPNYAGPRPPTAVPVKPSATVEPKNADELRWQRYSYP